MGQEGERREPELGRGDQLSAQGEPLQGPRTPRGSGQQGDEDPGATPDPKGLRSGSAPGSDAAQPAGEPSPSTGQKQEREHAPGPQTCNASAQQGQGTGSGNSEVKAQGPLIYPLTASAASSDADMDSAREAPRVEVLGTQDDHAGSSGSESSEDEGLTRSRSPKPGAANTAPAKAADFRARQERRLIEEARRAKAQN